MFKYIFCCLLISSLITTYNKHTMTVDLISRPVAGVEERISVVRGEAFMTENNTGNGANDTRELGVDWEQEEEITDELPEEIIVSLG